VEQQERVTAETGEGLLFADPIRFDIGQRVAVMAGKRQMEVSAAWRWTQLPTVTPDHTRGPAFGNFARARPWAKNQHRQSRNPHWDYEVGKGCKPLRAESDIEVYEETLKELWPDLRNDRAVLRKAHNAAAFIFI
jgi:hypothetical protein